MKALAAFFMVLVISACGGSITPAGNGDGGSNGGGGGDGGGVVPDAVESGCEEQLGSLIAALEELDGRLNVGLNYQDYAEKVGDASVAYERIDVEELGPNCLERVGSPAEEAMNAYISAYNTWNACIEDTDCDNDSITPDLQGEWADATELLDGARQALDE